MNNALLYLLHASQFTLFRIAAIFASSATAWWNASMSYGPCTKKKCLLKCWNDSSTLRTILKLICLTDKILKLNVKRYNIFGGIEYFKTLIPSAIHNLYTEADLLSPMKDHRTGGHPYGTIISFLSKLNYSYFTKIPQK